ncbi:MAG TPA: aminoglycoside phosphotransferase family protein [Pseudonocardiaceae bacterium]|nr:aminoglycoside phosphotransferase family protein [Pseudonocardiaceae bacterium]
MLGGSDERQRLRTERSRRAVAAAMALARRRGLRVEEPTVLADLFSVMVHLRPAPVVARVSTWTSKVRSPIAEWLAREIDVTSYLSGQGAPVVAPSRELPPGPHTQDGFAISFWTYLQPDPGRTPSAADCSAMLVDLHAGLRSYPGELPTLAPAVNDIPVGLAALDRVGDALDRAEVDRLHAAHERLRQFLGAPGGDLQPLHGDVHPNNIIATREGLVWIDFEDVSRGPAGWDLALLSWIDAEAVAAHHRPDPEVLAQCSDLRALHLALCLIAFRDDFGDLADWDKSIRSFLGMISPAS